MRVDALVAKWIGRAAEFRKLTARVDATALCEEVIADLRTAEIEPTDDLLTQDEAEQESGYTRQHLRRLVKKGELRASGQGRDRRVARRDLPRKPSVVAPRPANPHLLGAKAEQVVRDSAGVSHGTPR